MCIYSNIREQQLADKLAVARNITISGEVNTEINKSVFDDFEPDVIEKSKPHFHKYVSSIWLKGHYRYLYPEDMKNARIKTTVEEMVDEDTGDVVKIPHNTPIFSKETKSKLESKLGVLQKKYEEKRSEFEKLKDVSDGYDDKISDLRLQIKDLDNERGQLNVDMEQEVSQAEEQGSRPDTVGNEYGGKLNDIDEEKEKCWKEINELECKRNTLQNEDYWKLSVEVDELLYECDYLSSQIENMEFYDITKSPEEDIEKATSDQKQSKIAKVMREFYDGELRDSHGKQVTDKNQALAIAYSYFKTDDIEKSIMMVDDIIEKGKWAKPGEVRVWGDGRKYRKTAGGWELVKEGNSESKKEETKLDKITQPDKITVTDKDVILHYGNETSIWERDTEAGKEVLAAWKGKIPIDDSGSKKEDKVASSIANINKYEKKDIDLLTKVYSNAIKDKEDPKILDAMQKRLQELSKESDKKMVKVKVETSRSYRGLNKESYTDVFSVNGLQVATYKKGKDYYHTIKNGIPSNLRDKVGVTHEVRWNYGNMKKLLGDKFPDKWKGSRFEGGGPDLKWGDKGPVLTQSGVKEAIESQLNS